MIRDLTVNSSENSSINDVDVDELTSLEQENGDSVGNHSSDEIEITKNNLNNDLYLVSQDREQQVEEIVSIEDNDLIVNRSLDKHFKSEWIDTFYIPINYISTGTYSRQAGETIQWFGLYWSILLCFNENKNPGLGALFIGFKHFIQNISLKPYEINIRYQFLILDKNNVNISNNVLCKKGCTWRFSVDQDSYEARNDNGSFESFNLQRLLEYLKSTYDQTADMVIINNTKCYPFKVKILIEDVFVPMILPLHYNSKVVTNMVGLENLGATCYLNALLQMLYHINSFRCAVYKLPHDSESLHTSTTLALQNIFKNLQLSNKEVTTKELTIAFGWTSAEAFLQQDVQEMMRVLIDKLEEKMKGTIVDGYTKKLFAGQVRSYIRCMNIKFESKRVEDFYDIQLDVKGCRDIYESFEKYISMEVLNGDNQYDAGEYGKQDAQKGVIFESFPPVLTIHLKRFDFDLQTMGFTKIHDYFEFHTRINLDKYVLEHSNAGLEEVENKEEHDWIEGKSSTSTSCSNSNNSENVHSNNNYILHSVLVHQGDVGGGHYYAYIRPTTANFDYTSSVLQSDKLPDNQWYKFNDEVVNQVREREALDNCYGRRIVEQEYYRGLGSAYMLVYIRESEVSEIMKPVQISDIPPDLLNRLDSELKTKKAFAKQTQRQKNFASIYFITDEDVAAFNDYNRTQDFITERSMRDVSIIQNCTKMGLHLFFAEELKLHPLQFRIWIINKYSKSGSQTLRVFDEISSSEFNQKVATHMFYIQTFNNKMINKQLYADNQENDDETIDIINEFDFEYNLLMSDYKKILDEIRVSISSFEEQYYDIEEDPVSGCGLGLFNPALQDLKTYDLEQYTNYQRDIDRITDSVYTLMQKHYAEHEEEVVYVFIKVYDPQNTLYLSYGEDMNYDEGLNRVEDIQQITDGSANLFDTKVVIDNQLEVIFKQKKPKEYNPIKYIGYCNIRKNITVKELYQYVTKQLKLRLDLANQHYNIDNKEIYPEVWQNYEHFKISFYESPSKSMYIPLMNDCKPVKDIYTGFEDGAMLYLDLSVDFLDKDSFLIPWQYLIDSASWLKYRANKKEVILFPYDERDARIITELHQEHGRKIKNTLASNSSTEEDYIALLQGHGGKKRTRSYSQSLPNNSSSGGNTISGRMRSDSLCSIPNDLNTQITSQDTMKSNLSFQDTLKKQLVSLSNPKLCSMIEITMYMKISNVMEQIGKILQIDSDHIILYIVAVSELNILDIPVNDKEVADNVFPITLLQRDQTLLDVFNQFKINTKLNMKYIFYYRLLPYKLYDSINNIDLSKLYKSIDLIIVDERILYWRKLYLEYMKFKQNTEIHSDQDSKKHKIINESLSILNKNEYSMIELNHNHELIYQNVTIQLPLLNKEMKSNYLQEEDSEIVYIHALKTTSFEQICKLFRNLFGIPINIEEILKYKHIHNNINNNSNNSNIDIKSKYHELFLKDDKIFHKISTGEGNVCTDLLKIQSAFPLNNKHNNNNNNNNDIHTIISNNIREEYILYPSFPILIGVIRNKIIDEIYCYDRQIHDILTSWMDCTTPNSSLYKLCVQHVSPEDILYMQHRIPTVRSLIVTVYSFTLLGNVVDICESNGVYKPFLSYIREDDDVYTLSKRFSEITGESDWEKYKLAVVCDKIPYFFTKTNKYNHQLVENHDTHMDNNKQNESLFSLVINKYNLFNLQNLDNHDYIDIQQHFCKKNNRNYVRSYPQIGIQRSVTDMSLLNKQKYKKTGSTGIRIS